MLPLGRAATPKALRLLRSRAGASSLATKARRISVRLGHLETILCRRLAPNQLIGLFLDHNDPAFRDVINLAVSLLAVAAWFELFDGTQTIAMGCIRGLKDAKTTFLVGLGCYWLIGAPAAWWMAFHLNWGPTGVWWGLALGLACAAVSLTLAFEWKMKRMIRREPAAENGFQMAQPD